MLRVLFFIISCSILTSLHSQDTDYPKRELRAVWLTTVSNLDWPNKEDRGDAEAQKTSLISMLDSMQSINLNTIFFQVRTECDAFYNSAYEPWSRYLTGTQGVDPGYDPLSFAIEEAHKRGLELHAWMNPYRVNASTNDGGNYYSDEHVFIEHPEWLMAYPDGKKILNPGLPEVQDYIQNVVGDMISKYDVDGVHFDDYFYSYSGTDVSLDIVEFDEYGLEGESIGGFRRRSINKMVEVVNDTIKASKPYVRFGISPFGIYGNNLNPPGIIGLDAYNTIYCDPIAWLSEGTVDYINPQLYWPTGGNQDFATLLPWWAQQVEKYDRHVYSGHGTYRLDSDPTLSKFSDSRTVSTTELNLSLVEGMYSTRSADAWTLDQVVRQINITRSESEKGALGSVFFRADDFERVRGLKEKLKASTYSHQALWPEMTWRAGEKPEPPANLSFKKNEENGNFELSWDHSDTSMRFVVYHAKTMNASLDLVAENILGVSYENRFFPRNSVDETIEHVYVTAIDRNGRESANAELFRIPEPSEVTLLSPADHYALVTNEDMFSWKSAENSSFYQVIVATDSGFEVPVGDFEVRDTTFSVEEFSLEGESVFFWKVAGLSFAGRGAESTPWSFTTAFPKLPEVIYPMMLEVDVPLLTEIDYVSSDKVDSIFFQISEGGTQFESFRIVRDTVMSGTSQKYQLLRELKANTTHYLRYRAKNIYGETQWSQVIQFKSLQPVPNLGVVTEPANNEIFLNSLDEVNISWEKLALASRYQLQVAHDSSFSALILDKTVFNGTNFVFSELAKDSWHYIRVAGINTGGTGSWSEVSRFGLGTLTSVGDIANSKVVVVYPNPSVDGRYQQELVEGEGTNVQTILYDYLGRFIKVENHRTKGSSSVFLDYSQYTCNPCLLQVHYLDTGRRHASKIMHIRP